MCAFMCEEEKRKEKIYIAQPASGNTRGCRGGVQVTPWEGNTINVCLQNLCAVFLNWLEQPRKL